MIKRFIFILLSVVASLLGALPCEAQTEAATDTSAATCSALASADFSGIAEAPTQIVDAQIVEAKDGVPRFCQVRGYVWPQVGFELRLPVSDWNHKFIEIGCGGSCGHLGWTFWCPTHRGYACIASNMGHQSGKEQDGLWAYNNLQGQMDFGYRGAHVVAVAGKAITESYYRNAPKYSYFHGCSTGSRQALMEAQRYPWDFDGIIGGGVWVDDADTLSFLWHSRMLRNADGKLLFSKADIETLHQAALDKCDLDDGIKDGLIGNPLNCRFDPSTLRCKSGVSNGCLTGEQIDAANKVYSGPVTSAGEQLSVGGLVPGSERGWIKEPSDLGSGTEPVFRDGSASYTEDWELEYFRWMTLPPPGRGWNLKDFDFDRDYRRFSSGAQLPLTSANNPDLRKFKRAGGKLLLYVGWKDNVLPRIAVDYYETTQKTMGGPKETQDFFRLFTIPGTDHCLGGEGPWAIDYLGYMEAWVERGQAPDRLIGAHVDPTYFKRQGAPPHPLALRFPLEADVPTDFTRPIYPYPLWAKYKGVGDPRKAEHFEPTAP
jgi:feruloyl esterase